MSNAPNQNGSGLEQQVRRYDDYNRGVKGKGMIFRLASLTMRSVNASSFDSFLPFLPLLPLSHFVFPLASWRVRDLPRSSRRGKISLSLNLPSLFVPVGALEREGIFFIRVPDRRPSPSSPPSGIMGRHSTSL